MIFATAMQHMIDSITKGNIHTAYVWLFVMAIFFLAGDVPSYFFRQFANKLGWDLECFLYQYYMGKYLVGDNNSFESLGT